MVLCAVLRYIVLLVMLSCFSWREEKGREGQEGATARSGQVCTCLMGALFSLSACSLLCTNARHVVHALLEGHEAAKSSGLSQKNPVDQVGGKQYTKDTRGSRCYHGWPLFLAWNAAVVLHAGTCVKHHVRSVELWLAEKREFARNLPCL